MLKSKLTAQLNSAALAILGTALCVVPAQSFPASCVNLDGNNSATYVYPGQYLFAVTGGYVGLNFPALHSGVFSSSNPNTSLPMDTFQQAQARYQVPGVEPVPGYVSPWNGRMSWVIQSTDGFYHASNSGIAHVGGPALATYTVAPGDFAPSFSTLAVNKAALVCYQSSSKSAVPLQMSAIGDGPGPFVSGLRNGFAVSWDFNDTMDNTYATNSDPYFNFQLSGANN
jgi:hypothetical protein